MDLPEFAARLARELGLDGSALAPETKLAEIPDFDSMGMLRVMAMLDAEYGVIASVEELMTCETVRDVARVAEGDRGR